MNDIVWKSYQLGPEDGGWEPAGYNVTVDGREYGRWRRDLTILIHCCSGEPDEIVSIDLIDFEPAEQL